MCEGIKREKSSIKWREHMENVFDISKPFCKLFNMQKKIENLGIPPNWTTSQAQDSTKQR